VVKVNNLYINLQEFRKAFDIPAGFLKSICKILGIEIIKRDELQIIPLMNEKLNYNNDVLCLYAFDESNITGKLDNTRKNLFNNDKILLCEEKANEKCNLYVITEESKSSIIKKKPDNAIEITATTPSKEDQFINIISAAVARAVAEENKSILNSQEELYNAMEKGFLLTNEQLSKLLGMSKATISSKPDGWKRMGFQYTKIKEGSMTLWRISQY